MAYNYNPFPYAGSTGPIYPTTVPSYYPTAQNYQGMSNTGLNWVIGEAAAKSYPVANGAVVPLFDKDESVLYVKSVDMNGIPQIRIFDLHERIQQANIESSKNVTDDYVTKADMDEYADKIVNKVMQNIAALHPVNNNTYRDKKPNHNKENQ